MNKIVRYVLLAIALLALVSSIVLIVSFASFMNSGVYHFTGYAKLDFQKTVYFVDADSLEVSGSTTVTVAGLVRPTNSDGSSRALLGSMSVAQYPLTLEDGYGSFSAAVSDGAITVQNLLMQSSSLHTGVQYRLHLSANNPEIFAVTVYLEDGSTMTAYPGETAEEAIANCQAYWEWFSA